MSGWRRDGSVLQSGLRHYDADYAHERMNHNVVGVIESLYLSDDAQNKEARKRADFRGSRIEATVVVTNEGKDAYWRIPHVVIPPKGTSGPDNYHEELPRASTRTLDGSDTIGVATDPSILDGDYCVVGFIGGHIDQPFMISWWPHPRNRRDPATEDSEDQGYLEQGQRLVKRFQGTKIALTSTGSVHLDTSEANAEVTYKEGDSISRKKREKGGDIKLSVKDTRELEVNFNAPVPEPIAEPDLLQPNPPKGTSQRADELSRFFMNKDFINAVAGRVVQIMGNNDGTDRKNTVLLGENPTDHVLLAERFQARYNELVAKYNDLVSKFNGHIHIGNQGSPTSGPNISPPVPNPSFNPTLPPDGTANPPFLTTSAPGAVSTSESDETDRSEVVYVE